jgi:hypothetical protein
MEIERRNKSPRRSIDVSGLKDFIPGVAAVTSDDDQKNG